MLNSYARVIGAVRSQGGNKSIMIYKIDTVKGINEVNTHYLEVLNARYMAEEFAKVCNTIHHYGISYNFLLTSGWW